MLPRQHPLLLTPRVLLSPPPTHPPLSAFSALASFPSPNTKQTPTFTPVAGDFLCWERCVPHPKNYLGLPTCLLQILDQMSLLWVEPYLPKTRKLKSSPPGPQDVTFLVNEITADVIRSDEVTLEQGGPLLSGSPYKKGQFEHRHAHMETATLLPQAKDCQQLGERPGIDPSEAARPPDLDQGLPASRTLQQ